MMIKSKVKIIVIVLPLLVLIAASFCYAQNKFQAGIRFIPQATSFRYDTDVRIKDFLKLTPYYFRVRTAQGIGILYYPHKRWSVGADLLYSLQGGGYESRKSNINYVKMPVWLGYNASLRHRLIFNIQAGIDIAYVVNAKMKYGDGETINISSYVNHTNWGIPVAIGLKFKLLQTYFLNTQWFLYTDFKSLAKTNSTFQVKDYILPGFRFSIDRNF